MKREPRVNRGRTRRCDPVSFLLQEGKPIDQYATVRKDGKAVKRPGESEDLPEMKPVLPRDKGSAMYLWENQGPRIDSIGPGFFFAGPETAL